MNYYALYPDELYHYGTKGMHWGIRQYQNSDGTLTALGRIHYGVKGFYDGPQMEHIRSSIKRGWYTANDPDFLGRKMSEVQKTVGRAADLTKRRDFWNHDVNDIIPFIKNWMNPEQYNVIDVTGSTSADAKGDTTSATSIDWSGAKVGGYANKVIDVTNPGRTYIDPDQYDFGNMLINVYESYQDARNIKMSDLAEFSIDQKVIESTKSTSNEGITTARRITTVNQPIETTVGAISYNPTNKTSDSGQQILFDTVVTDVDDRIERKYYDKVRKKATELNSMPTVSKQEAANNKALQLQLQQMMISGNLNRQQMIEAGNLINSLNTTTIEDIDNHIKNYKESTLQDYRSAAANRDAKAASYERAAQDFIDDLLKRQEAFYRT